MLAALPEHKNTRQQHTKQQKTLNNRSGGSRAQHPFNASKRRLQLRQTTRRMTLPPQSDETFYCLSIGFLDDVCVSLQAELGRRTSCTRRGTRPPVGCDRPQTRGWLHKYGGEPRGTIYPYTSKNAGNQAWPAPFVESQGTEWVSRCTACECFQQAVAQ